MGEGIVLGGWAAATSGGDEGEAAPSGVFLPDGGGARMGNADAALPAAAERKMNAAGVMGACVMYFAGGSRGSVAE